MGSPVMKKFRNRVIDQQMVNEVREELVKLEFKDDQEGRQTAERENLKSDLKAILFAGVRKGIYAQQPQPA